MSRYVDTEYIKAVMLNDRLMQGNAEFTLYAQQVETQVNALPSIEIVRCKDCKYWVSDGGALMRCDIHKDPTVPDHYCSYGEEDKDE